MNKPYHAVQIVLKDMCSMLALSALLFLMLYSCKDDDLSIPVRAGVFSGMNHVVFDPPISVHLVDDSIHNVRYGIDSIDIDQDGRYDFFLTQNFLLPDKVPYNADFPFTRVFVKNGLEVATQEETYYAGLGYYCTVTWVDTLVSNRRIDFISEWSGTGRTVYLWYFGPAIYYHSFGSWFDITNTCRYIGLRMKIYNDFIWGWVKVYQNTQKNIEILEYAIQKTGA